MAGIRFLLFGHFSVFQADSQDEIKLSRSMQSILAYLLVNRHRSYSREMLAGLFWGENTQDLARKCLNTTLWRLRHSIEGHGSSNSLYLTTTSSGEIGFNRHSPFWLDVAEFSDTTERVIKIPQSAAANEDIGCLENSLGVYTSDLLEGFYDDWVIHERERLRLLYLKGLAYLSEYYKRQADYEKSLSFCLKILEIDPLREEVHREAMRLYDANGQRTAAIRQFELCRQILEAELNIPPMPETLALRNAITSQIQPFESPDLPQGRIPSQQILAQLTLTSQALAQTQVELSKLVGYIQDWVSQSKP